MENMREEMKGREFVEEKDKVFLHQIF